MLSQFYLLAHVEVGCGEVMWGEGWCVGLRVASSCVWEEGVGGEGVKCHPWCHPYISLWVVRHLYHSALRPPQEKKTKIANHQLPICFYIKMEKFRRSNRLPLGPYQRNGPLLHQTGLVYPVHKMELWRFVPNTITYRMYIVN